MVVACDMQEQFERDYTAVQRRAMTTNYRSTASIIARSNALIACNYANPDRPGRLPKALTAAPGTLCNDPVQFVRYRSEESQGQHILETVNWLHKNGNSTHWFNIQSVCLSVCLSTCVSVCLSVCLCVCLSVICSRMHICIPPSIRPPNQPSTMHSI